MLCSAFLSRLKLFEEWLIIQDCIFEADKTVGLWLLLSLSKTVVRLKSGQAGGISVRRGKPAWL